MQYFILLKFYLITYVRRHRENCFDTISIFLLQYYNTKTRLNMDNGVAIDTVASRNVRADGKNWKELYFSITYYLTSYIIYLWTLDTTGKRKINGRPLSDKNVIKKHDVIAAGFPHYPVVQTERSAHQSSCCRRATRRQVIAVVR